MIKMKKLSATTFAMALSLGGLALGAGCEKGDKDKPAPSAGPTDPAKPDPAPAVKPDNNAQGAAPVVPAADKPADPVKPAEPTNTLPANKEPAAPSCAGSPKGCGPKPPEKKVEIKAGTGTGAKVETKVEVKNPAPDDDGCGGCGPPPKAPEIKAGGTVTTEKKPAENSCSKKSCG
jgi:hypothetical protein